MSLAPPSSERVAELLARVLPRERVGTFAGGSHVPARPEAAPGSVEEAIEVLRLARAERWNVLPLGNGSKLAWLRPPARVDLVLTSRNLRGVTAYEPADGTLTALAGTPWSELVRATEVRHHLSPELPDAARATLGGTIASGASGLDRLRHGPMRHQILGLAALQADGARVKSGGRVVKNVTGYDLHRLWCGSEGSLCFLLEGTLRLYPAPAETLVLRARGLALQEALARSHALWRARVQPLAVVVRLSAGDGAGELAVVLAGRAEAVASEAALVEQHAGPVELLRGDEARAARAALRELERARERWAPLVVSTRPSAFAQALATLTEAAQVLGLAPELTLQPLLARASVEFPGVELADARLAQLAARLAEAPFQVRWRGLAAEPPPRVSAEAAELMRRLKTSLDPDGLFAGGPA